MGVDNSTVFKDVLDGFLSKKEGGVYVIKGSWGVGKTEYWKRYIKKYLEANEAVSYSYVSLFGLASLEELKVSILKNKESFKKIAEKVNDDLDSGLFLKSLKKGVKLDVSKLLGFGKLVESLQGIKIASSVLAVAGEYISEGAVICFDDLERKSKLELEVFMGYVDKLSRENSCKVVMIFNEDVLCDRDRDVFNGYREKIVDGEILYNPSLEENLKIVFEKDVDKVLESVVSRFDIKNIRVLHKIRLALDYLADEEVGIQIKRNIIFLVYYYYIERDLYDYVKKTRINKLINTDRDSDKDLDVRLSSDGYVQQDADLYISDYIECGYCNLVYYKNSIPEILDRERMMLIGERFSDVFDKRNFYWLDRDKEYYDEIVNFLLSDLMFLPYRNYRVLADLISFKDREIEFNENYLKWNKHYEPMYVGMIKDYESGKFNLSSEESIGIIHSIIENEKYSLSNPVLDLKDSLMKSISSNDIYRIKDISDDDLEDMVFGYKPKDFAFVYNKLSENIANQPNYVEAIRNIRGRVDEMLEKRIKSNPLLEKQLSTLNGYMHFMKNDSD